MKIISVDSLDRDSEDDWLIAENIRHEFMAKTMCDALDKAYCLSESDRYYKVVPDNYKLRVFAP